MKGVLARAAIALTASAVAVLAPLTFGACSSKGNDATAPSDGADASSANAEQLFRALQPELVKTCGGPNATCHVTGTYQQAPTWLADPDPYASAKRYPGILPATREVGDSILLTQVAHEGPALTTTPKLFEQVATWLQAEVPPPPLPNTGAFTVQSGINSLNLHTVAPGLDGAKLTFLATEANGVLTLSALRFTAPQNATVKIASPFFVVLPRSGKVNADPERNGFRGEMTVQAGTTADMFDGKMVLLRWDPTGQLKIAFASITSTPDQGVAQGCTALDVFQSQAVPALREPRDAFTYDDGSGVDAGVPVTLACVGCHGKASDATTGADPAVQALDLTLLDADVAKACAQARNWINFRDRAASTLLLNPTGRGNPQHPTKPLSQTDSVVAGLAAWVNAEREK